MVKKIIYFVLVAVITLPIIAMEGPNIQNELLRAITRENLEETQRLLKLGANPNLKVNFPGEQVSYLKLASTIGNSALVSLLLNYGADPALDEALLCTIMTTISGRPGVPVSIMKQRKEAIIDLLINHPGINLNCKDSMGKTPLMLEVQAKNVDRVNALLNTKRVDINAEDLNGQTALDYAAGRLKSKKTIQEVLEKHGALHGSRQRKIPAVTISGPAASDLYFKMTGFMPKQPQFSGEKPASAYPKEAFMPEQKQQPIFGMPQQPFGSFPAFGAPMPKQPIINPPKLSSYPKEPSVSFPKQVPLFAFPKQTPEIVAGAFAPPANPEQSAEKNKDLQLRKAIHEENLQEVTALINQLNDPNTSFTESSPPPLVSAVYYNKPTVINYLLQNPRINPNALWKYRNTRPIDVAVFRGNTEAVKALLNDPRTNIKLKSIDGKTLQHIALEKKYEEIAELLHQRDLQNAALAATQAVVAQEVYQAMGIPQNASPHVILGIAQNASPDIIRAAFKAKILQWHPDRNQNTHAAEAVKLIRWAYDTLGGK